MISIDVSGPEGNALLLAGVLKDVMQQTGKTKEEIKAAREDLLSGDNNHLLRVFQKHCGRYVELKGLDDESSLELDEIHSEY